MPAHQCQGHLGRGHGLVDKAKPSVGIALRVASGQRLLEETARGRKIPHREATQTSAALSGRNFYRASFILGLSQERRREISRNPRVPTYDASNPLAVICYEP